MSIVAFDATDFDRLGNFFDELSTPIDHVLVTGPGPYYAPLTEFDVEKARPTSTPICYCRCRSPGTPRARFAREGPCSLWAARVAAARRGTRVHLGTHGRDACNGQELALEIAPVRVNLIAAGFVDTPLSAAILGDQLDARRERLRTTLPIRRVVGPADIAALAVHLMTNTAITGATSISTADNSSSRGEPVGPHGRRAMNAWGSRASRDERVRTRGQQLVDR